MKKIFLLIAVIIAVMAVSCNDKECLNVTSGMWYMVVDGEGNDLLDPGNPDAIDASAIKVTYIDGNGKEVNVDSNSYGLISAEDNVMVNYYTFFVEPGIDDFFVHWPGGVTDKVEYRSISGKCYYWADRVTVNNQVAWQREGDSYFEAFPTFKIVIDGGQWSYSVVLEAPAAD